MLDGASVYWTEADPDPNQRGGRRGGRDYIRGRGRGGIYYIRGGQEGGLVPPLAPPWIRHWYWSVPIREQAIEKTVFLTPRGNYEFRVMPFGLTNGPSMYQRTVDRAMKGLDFSQPYIDYILVFSPDYALHLQHLRRTLQAYRYAIFCCVKKMQIRLCIIRVLVANSCGKWTWPISVFSSKDPKLAQTS